MAQFELGICFARFRQNKDRLLGVLEVWIPLFGEILDTLDKPKFSIDDRWYPDINDNEFNEMLSDRLSEI